MMMWELEAEFFFVVWPFHSGFAFLADMPKCQMFLLFFFFFSFERERNDDELLRINMPISSSSKLFVRFARHPQIRNIASLADSRNRFLFI